MDMRDQILESAQRLVQQRGFNGFSYADIAAEVGIRKSSLHHHFPSKTDLGVALMEKYAAQLEGALLELSDSSIAADKKLASYINVYRSALEAERMCLGGMLATEVLTLDEVMLPSLRRFFARNTEWLTEVLKQGQAENIFVLSSTAETHANLLVSALQGALLLARATGDHKKFEQTALLLMTSLLRKG